MAISKKGKSGAYTTLARERRWVVATLSLAPAVVVSGVVTWIAPIGWPYWIQACVVVHALTGVLATPIVLGYAAIHFYRTFGNRVFSTFASGLVAALLMVLACVTGLWLVVYGQAQTHRWVLDAHIASSAVLVVAVLGHVAGHWLRNRRKRRPQKDPLASLGQASARAAVVSVVIAGMLAGGVTGLGHYIGASAQTAPVPDGYRATYGDQPFAPSEVRVTSGRTLKKSALVRSRECGGCHEAVYDQWRSSVHRKAALDPAYERNARLLASKKGTAALRYCEGCHAPVALLSGELVDGGQHGGIDGVASNEAGVNCISCHEVDAVRHTKGVGSYRIGLGASYLFEYAEPQWLRSLGHWVLRMRPELHRRRFDTEKVDSPAFCATCHAQYMDERMNDWGWVKMQDQYQSWLRGPFSGKNAERFGSQEVRRCADCHMADDRVGGHSTGFRNPSADRDGKVASHWFPGANTFVPKETGDSAHLRRVRRFLSRDKVRVSLEFEENERAMQSQRAVDEALGKGPELPGYYFLGQRVRGVVLISNVNVGHKFPAGTNDIHEAWLALEVRDAQGRRVWSWGRRKGDGRLPDDAYVYKSVKVDEHGNEVWKHDLFNMVGERYTNVIPAGETDVVEFGFEVPYWAAGPLSVTAELNYRKFNKRYGSWVMRDPGYTAPVTVVGRDSAVIEIVAKKGAEQVEGAKQ